MSSKRSSHEISKRRRAPIRAMASGIPVFCNHDRLANPDELKPHPKNEHHQHPAKQLDAYETVIAGTAKKKGNGWRKAVTISDRSSCITKGHGAWLMAKRRGWLVPIEVQHYGSEAEEVRDLLADNKLSSLAVTDNEKLAKLLAELDPGDLELAAFSDGELEKMLRDSETVEGEFPITAKLGESYDYVLIFTTNSTEFVFLQSLLNIRQEKSYKKTGVGLGRAIPLAHALKSLRENRHSLDVASGNNDDAPAHPERRRLRSRVAKK